MRNQFLRPFGLIAAGFVLGAMTVFGVLVAGLPAPKPPLPPLLENVSAGGGWWGACPPATQEEAREREGSPLATSPELSQHLAQRFPAGSRAKTLVDTLQKQGFELLPSCHTDPSIHVAAFEQYGGGLLVVPILANVFWKVDDAGNILWTKGFVRYKAL